VPFRERCLWTIVVLFIFLVRMQRAAMFPLSEVFVQKCGTKHNARFSLTLATRTPPTPTLGTGVLPNPDLWRRNDQEFRPALLHARPASVEPR
jgi:hypothetical protein